MNDIRRCLILTLPLIALVIGWLAIGGNGSSAQEKKGKTDAAGQPKPARPAEVHGDPARLERIAVAKMPKIEQPVMFDTEEADAICSALEVFPPDNPWNLVIEDWPLHRYSKIMVRSIGRDKPLLYNSDMGFILVPPDQSHVNVTVTEFADESDQGPFPVPNGLPIEGWPLVYRQSEKHKGLSLEDIQRDKLNEKGDRHAIVVDPVNRMLYEFVDMVRTDTGWQAAQASIFDLKSNRQRPLEWTSADAAGLPIFPAVVRYDELKRGRVEHAMRVNVMKTRRAFVYPATHHASRLTDPILPRMGERLRLRKDFDVSRYSPEVQAILKGLKKYGMFVANNGIDWTISVAPDPRIRDLHAELRNVKGADFEVVEAPPGFRPPPSANPLPAVNSPPGVNSPPAVNSPPVAHELRTRSRRLYGFENPTDATKLQASLNNASLITVQDNGVTDGKNCARLVVTKGADYGGFSFDKETCKTWGEFDYFAMDVMTEDEEPYSIAFELWDAASKNYATRCTLTGTKLRPGRQTLLYPINRARRNGKEGRDWQELEAQDKINLNGLTQVKLFLTPRNDRDAIFWIDNLRLLQEDAAKPKFHVPLPKGAIAFKFGSAGTSSPGFETVPPSKTIGTADSGFVNSEGLTHGGEGWPDLLAGTFVAAPEGKPIEFQARVTSGEYQLWLVASPILRRSPLNLRYLLRVNESSILDATPNRLEYNSEKWLFRFLNTQFSEKPHALWENYIDKMYAVHVHPVSVKDGLLKIVAVNHFLSAAVLAPTAAKDEFDTFVQEVRRLRIEAFEQNVRPLAEKKPPRRPGDGDIILYVPEPAETVRPWSGPNDKERDTIKLRAAAAPGQRTVMRLAVVPHVDAGRCTLELADFSGPARLPASAISGYFQNYRYDGDTLSEMALVPSLTLNVESGITQCLWLWLAVPEKMPAGTYKSVFIFKSERHGSTKIPVELQAHPFRLETTLPLSLGMYYQDLQAAEKLTREQLQFMRKIGFTAIPVGAPAVQNLGSGDAVRLQFDASLLEYARAAGMGRHPKQYLTGKALGMGRAIGRRLPGSSGAKVDQQPGIELRQPGFRGYFMNALKQYRSAIEKSGLPVAVEIVDEPREVPNPWNRNLSDTIAYAQMVREAGLKGFITPMADTNAGKNYTVLADVADIVSVHAWKASAGLMAKSRENKATLWLYNMGMDRFSWGFYNWRAGSEGRWEWHFCWPEDTATGGYPGREWYNPFTGSHGMAPLAPANYPGGMFFNSAFLDVCEGINDYAYLYTLETTIEQCEKEGKRAESVQEAKAFLEALRRVIPAIPGTKGLVDQADGALVGLGIDDESRLQAPQWRAKIAEMLIKLTGPD